MLLPLLLPLELSPVQPAEIPCVPKQHGVHQITWLQAVPKPHGEARRPVCISISTCGWFIMPTNFLQPHPLPIMNHKNPLSLPSNYSSYLLPFLCPGNHQPLRATTVSHLGYRCGLLRFYPQLAIKICSSRASPSTAFTTPASPMAPVFTML